MKIVLEKSIIKIRSFRIWLVLLIFQIWTIAADSPEEIVRKVEKAIQSSPSLKIQFEEIYYWSLTGEENRLEGEMFLGKDNRFRIETEDQTIVSDGKILWTYSKPSNRVLIDQIIETDQSLLPMQIFFRFTKGYEVKSLGEEKIQDLDCQILKFQSKSDDELIPEITVWVDQKKWLPRRIEQMDLSDNKSVYLLKQIEQERVAIKSDFIFQIPEGAEVIEMQQ